MSKEFLKNFFNTEIYFLGNKTMQEKNWSNAQGEKFGECLMLTYQAWDVIKEHRKNYDLTDSQFKKTQTLFDMIEEFQLKINYPTKPTEYLSLLGNPEWVKIRKYAAEVYETINPHIK